MGVRVWFWWLLCILLAGCESAAPSAPKLGSGAFGEPCLRTEDCASGLCVRLDEATGVCTVRCQADSACPSADNWACLSSAASNLDVCACRKLADREICGDGIDNECNGKVDDCRQCNGVAVPDDDPKNCGACGVVCSPSQVCQGGKCSCPLSASDACGDTCTTLAIDGLNCGTCGKSCGSERSCSAGDCVCTDTTHPNFCDGVGCLSFADNVNHCGGCQTACALGQVCKAGACACPASDAPNFCDGVGCLNQATDPKNCGACGHACVAGFTCSEGKCVCPEGQTDCDGVCADTKTNPAHCGSCGSACGAAQACSASSCGCSQLGFKVCSGACADLNTDVKNCGACDKTCNPTQVCQFGSCSCPSATQSYCSNASSCVNLSTNANNCGTCGKQCPAGTHCGAGTCLCDTAGQTLCSNSCFDLQSDEGNCSACGKACAGSQQCAVGKCLCPAATPGVALRLTTNSNDDRVPKLAWDGTHVGVAYRSYTGAADNVRFALLATDGTVISDIALTAFDGTTLPQTVNNGPLVVWSGTEYGVLWVQRTISDAHDDVAFRRISTAGVPIAPAVDVAGHDPAYADYRYGIGMAWSPSYAGFGVVYLSSQSGTSFTFRRIGATGVAPEPENKLASFYNAEDSYSMAVAPDGTWGATNRWGTIDLNLYEPNGAHTLPTAHLSNSGSRPTMLHDGKTWLTAFIDAQNTNATSIWVNRGATANTPTRLLAPSTTVANYDASLTMVNGTLAVAFTKSPVANDNGPFSIGLQRFAIPLTATSALAAIDSPVEILSTATVSNRGDMQIVPTGSSSLLAVWADNRWGSNRELYARPIDLHSCP